MQGVNLTRPFPARLIGMAKLTLEGAGTGADVALEYLATNRAEQVRADILRLASGVRQAKAEANAPAAHAPEERASVAGTFNQGVTNIIDGVDTDDVVPESVVRIPIGRLIASQAITGLLWLLFFFVLIIAFVIVPIAIFEDGPEKWLVLAITAVTTGIPMVIAVVAIVWSALLEGIPVLDRADPRWGARIERTAHHRDPNDSSGSRPRRRGDAESALAPVRLVERAHQPHGRSERVAAELGSGGGRVDDPAGRHACRR